MPKNQGKQTRIKYTMTNMPLHQNRFILQLEVQMITQRCLLGPLGLQKVISKSSPLQKYPIYPREGTEPCGTKPQYEG